MCTAKALAVPLIFGAFINVVVRADDVSCTLTVDNAIQAVYVDGVDVTSTVCAAGTCDDWRTAKTLTFPDTAKTLAVEAYDREAGCTGGGFAIKCTSSKADSDWNMDSSENDIGKWKVYSQGAQATYPNTGYNIPQGYPSTHYCGSDMVVNWYEPGFDLTQDFGTPQPGDTTYADSIILVDDMCESYGNPGRYWMFVFVAPTYVPLPCPVDGCTSATATNYNSAATRDDGSCCESAAIRVDGSCCEIVRDFNTDNVVNIVDVVTLIETVLS